LSTNTKKDDAPDNIPEIRHEWAVRTNDGSTEQTGEPNSQVQIRQFSTLQRFKKGFKLLN